MDFLNIALSRQSCRNYNPTLNVEDEKLKNILKAAALAPSACNAQPYHFTVCKGEFARRVAEATTGIGINNFTKNVPVMIVISEEDYNKTAALGAKLKQNDYRSIDIGITVAYLTAEATTQGLGTCILGWFDNEKIKTICGLKNDVRLVVALGYPTDMTIHNKKRKNMDELVTYND